ncbi:MAG: transcriptional repressor [Eubacteriales bacterium]|nr:transcriptional repressor [Eubacteriales bacterium]
MEAATKRFRKREAILSCLRRTRAHPSAEGLHQLLQADHPDISLATVYRNLALFKSQGLIASLGTVGGIERFDGNTDPHVHFVCQTCGEVLDLPGLDPPDSLCGAAARAVGGRVDSCQLTFTGECPRCLNSAKLS